MLGALVLALLVVLLLVAVAVAEPVTHVHASGRYDRPTALMTQEIRGYVARPAVSLVTVTEVHERTRADALHRVPGWGARTPAATDLGVMWRRSVWRYRWARVLPLVTDARLPVALLVVVLDHRPSPGRAVVTLSHLPTGVEWGGRWSAQAGQVSGWLGTVKRWHRLNHGLERRWRPTVRLAVADWNVNIREPFWRRVLADTFPALRVTWRRPYPERGTHRGGRIIDATLATVPGRARLLPSTPASDHRAYIERLFVDGRR